MTDSKKNSFKIYSILIGLLMVFVGLSFYFYKKTEALKANPDTIAKEEALELTKKVSKLILLPKELPTVATVSDPEKLKDQPFFAKAKVGDKVLLFPQAKKAYLYDPVAHKVLEVAPINQEVDTSVGTQ